MHMCASYQPKKEAATKYNDYIPLRLSLALKLELYHWAQQCINPIIVSRNYIQVKSQKSNTNPYSLSNFYSSQRNHDSM